LQHGPVFLLAFIANQSGVTLIEYGAIAVLIDVAMLAGLKALNGSVVDLYDAIRDAVT
jgi:Flp pilus assembly pilin Flp